jgi:hypothetical protein
MRTGLLNSHVGLFGIFAASLVWAQLAKAAADFTVTTPGDSFNFTINGTALSPTITLIRGRLYQFSIGTSGFHPFQLMNAGVPLTTASGVTNNNISSGTIFFRVPTNAANYSYRCGFHTSTTSLMGNIVTIPPPSVRIVSFNFTSNIVLRSTGTNLFTLIPEFNTNLNTTNWFALTVQTNRFLSGTNETICGRPPGSNVFFRVRAVGN